MIRGYVTDGFSFYGLEYKETNTPRGLLEETLVSQKVQYEMALAGLQSETYHMQPQDTQQVTFFAYVESDHPQPTQDHDREKIDVISEKIQSLDHFDHSSHSQDGQRESSVFRE